MKMPRPTAGSDAAHPKFFKTSQELRAWLEKHHTSVSELWVGLYKKSSGKPSITWPELVDQLLCFGWIDGLRKSVDEISYANRVTPRRAGSNWSAVNLRRIAELLEAGAVHPAGLHAYELRDPAKVDRYSFEREDAVLDPEMVKKFKRNVAAWRFFTSQPPSYRKTATWWVTSAKREETRLRRLDTLISDSAAGQRIGPMRRANSRSDGV
jgi:uncharacterized protein YdeI (YjbR/CyaY-like superfamily)